MSNNLYILFVCSLTLHTVFSIADYMGSDAENWNLFKKKFNKTYANNAEEESRMKTFLANLKRIEDHNKLYDEGKVSYKQGINDFSDLTFEEFMKPMGPVNMSYGLEQLKKHSHRSPRMYHNSSMAAAPNSKDWRKDGAVTPVKSQGKCASCWAFSAVAALEALNFRNTGKLQDLSEQELVDCSRETGNTGCDGGFKDLAFEYLKQRGVTLESKYPYEGRDRSCRRDKGSHRVYCKGYRHIRDRDEDGLKNAVGTVGPVSVSVFLPESFVTYSDGVYEGCDEENWRLKHAIVVVGYGTTEEGKDYWLVKNSWGKKWGDRGFGMIARNRNMCGIAESMVYPV